MKTIMVTGGAGFIGSALIRHIINDTQHKVVNVDKLTYAGNLASLKEINDNKRYSFEQVDICNGIEVKRIFTRYQPDIVMHLAAESHVDRSIYSPDKFIQTNIVGTYTLLELAKFYWLGLKTNKKAEFRFQHISTDEVYGDLPHPNYLSKNNSSAKPILFTETTPYAPSSPYAASKASSNHLVRAWHHTFGLPILISNCSNNYGPYHFPEKLILLIILNALNGKALPIYGKGNQIRDWLYVEDHAKALMLIAKQGKIAQTYNVGGHCEKQNIEVVYAICDLLEELAPVKPTNIKNFISLITLVPDRAGHDIRYAIDASKIRQQLGWNPKESFDSGLRKTVQWYLANLDWCRQILKDNKR